MRALTLVSAISDKLLDETHFAVYHDHLADLTGEQIAFGLSNALRMDPYFPSPSRLRQLCGVPTEEDNARDALAWLLGYLRRYGVDGQTKPAAGRDEEGADGRVHRVQTRPAEQPPALPDVLQRTLALLCGGDDPRGGLQMLRTHPSMSGWDPNQGMEPVWVSEKIEARFHVAFHRARLGYGQRALDRVNRIHSMRPLRASAGSEL